MNLSPNARLNPPAILVGDYASVALCDGYKAYDLLAREREGSDLTIADCWAHVRREFVKAEPTTPQLPQRLAVPLLVGSRSSSLHEPLTAAVAM